MNKLAYYIRLVKMIRQMRDREKLLSGPLSFGNIAYFVDRYLDEKNFPRMWEQLEQAVREDDTNLLCWKLYQWNYEAKMETMETRGRTAESEIEFMEFGYELMRKSYKEGTCDNFWLATREDFPDWFFEYVAVKTAAGEDL